MSSTNILSSTMATNKLQSLRNDCSAKIYVQLQQIISHSGGLPYKFNISGIGERTIKTLFKSMGFKAYVSAPFGAKSPIRTVKLQRVR